MDADLLVSVYQLQALMFCLTIHTGFSQQSVAQLQISSHQFFQYGLLRENFFDRFSLGSEERVTFHPSLVTSPGLPHWLHFTLTSASGILHGTPLTSDIGEYELEVFGENLDTFESSRVLLNIEVKQPTNDIFPQYHAVLFIQNLNIEDMLNLTVQQKLIEGASSFWGQGSTVSIYEVKSAKQLGLRNVIPDRNAKEGVQVVLSSSQSPSQLQEDLRGISCEDEDSNPIPTLQQEFTDFVKVRWCQVVFETITARNITEEAGSPVFLGGEFYAPPLAVEDSSDFVGFLLIVVVPSVILLAIVFVLICMMFCNRQGIEKRNQRTPEIQLAHHNMIRQASQELRSLSNRRDGGPTPVGSNTPQFASTPNMRGSRSTSRTVLPHQTPPPPYRLPPEARKKKETSFSNPRDTRRLSEPTQAKG